MVAQWASRTAADATVMKGVMASGLLSGVPGLESDARLPLDALTAVLMEQVTRNNEALVQDAAHPLRQLLNRLFATLASGPSAEELPRLKEWVESAGRVLLHQPQQAAALLADLERLGASSLLRRRDRLLERQLEQESWHRMLRAKQRSREALDKSLAGLSLHRQAAAFVRQYWVHVLTMIALRHNPGTRAWTDAEDVVRALGSCPLTPEQVEILEAIARRELGAYFSGEDAAEALEGWLQQLGESPSEVNSLSWKGLSAGDGGAMVSADSASKPVLGSWARFADKPWPYPLQLIWSSLPFGYLGFTDASAERSFRMEASEWARLVASGRLEDYGATSFDDMPPLLDRNLESWTYENQLLSTLRDGSTGLLNRRGLVQAIAASDAEETQAAWQLLVMELPRLAEQYLGEGQDAGDKALSDVVGMLRSQDYPGLILARLGEARFAAAAPQAETGLVDVFRPLLEKQCLALQAGWFFHLGYCPEAPPGEGLIQAAEEAVEVARGAGQNSLQVKAISESRLESWMRATTRIIREGRLELHAQPMQALKDGLLSHAEILLRLKSEDDQYHSPTLFLREAERQKLMPQVDLWVLRSLGDWLQGRSQLPQQWSGVSINLSGQTLSDPGGQEAISSWLRQSGVDPGWLIFEITETSAVANLDQVGGFLRGLREQGCRTALDDFGSGYANYTYLRELPFDYLKIDGSFVRNLAENESDRALVGSMAEVARRFGLKSVAEYVHSMELVPILKELGVDYAQGYALGEPLPLSQLDA
jgi:EAL domain-containing protein (putative c-di-GMP-specific phosphodiesterase class I)